MREDTRDSHYEKVPEITTREHVIPTKGVSIMKFDLII
jgi:hypothetical protein